MRDRITLSVHAIDRYHERVKPALSRGAAQRELLELLERCPITDQAPDWLFRDELDESDAYAEISDGLVVPLRMVGTADDVAYVALTTIIRSCYSDQGRRQANEWRRRKRQAKRSAKRDRVGRPERDTAA